MERAYLDQLERSKGLAPGAIADARAALANAERQSGAQRKTTLTELASRLKSASASGGDHDKVQTVSAAVTDLANAQR